MARSTGVTGLGPPVLTFHEACVHTAGVAEVPHVESLQTVIPQLPSVAQALQNGVHEALKETSQTISALRGLEHARRPVCWRLGAWPADRWEVVETWEVGPGGRPSGYSGCVLSFVFPVLAMK